MIKDQRRQLIAILALAWGTLSFSYALKRFTSTKSFSFFWLLFRISEIGAWFAPQNKNAGIANQKGRRVFWLPIAIPLLRVYMCAHYTTPFFLELIGKIQELATMTWEMSHLQALPF